MNDITRFEAHPLPRFDVRALEQMLDEHSLAQILESLALIVAAEQECAHYMRQDCKQWNADARALQAARTSLEQSKAQAQVRAGVRT